MLLVLVKLGMLLGVGVLRVGMRMRGARSADSDEGLCSLLLGVEVVGDRTRGDRRCPVASRYLITGGKMGGSRSRARRSCT